MNIVLLGAPGSGKGTHSSFLKEHLNIPHISTGEIFREAMAKGSELGLLAKTFIDKGNLVPDNVTIGLVKERLSKPDCKNGFILDGYPRTLLQAKELNNFIKLDVVFYFDISLDVALKRILSRRMCQQCGAIYNLLINDITVCEKCGGDLHVRRDDNQETVSKRFEVYNELTYPLIGYYNELRILERVDADRSIKNITQTLKELLGEMNERNNKQ